MPPKTKRRRPLEAQIRRLLGEIYGLDAGAIDEFSSDAPIFGKPLRLDSLDSMSFVVAIEDRFGLTLANDEATRRAFTSLRRLTRHLEELLTAGHDRSPTG